MKNLVWTLLALCAGFLQGSALAQSGLPNPRFIPTWTNNGSIGATCYVNGIRHASISAALTACSSNSTILVITNQTLSASLSVSGAGIRLTCAPGVVITVAQSVSITVTGANFEADHCQYVGPGQAVLSSSQLYIIYGNNSRFHDNEVSQFGATGGSSSANAIVEWITANRLKGFNNYFHNNGDISMGVQPGANNVDEIEFYGNNSGNILISPSTGNVATNVRVHDNFTRAGDFTGAQSLCLYIVNADNVSVTNNKCMLVGSLSAGRGGAFSYANLTRFDISGNSLKNNGFTYQDYSHEYNGMIGGRISGNYGEADAVNGNGQMCESCNTVSFVGNTQNGWKTGAAGLAFTETNGAFSTMTALAIADNNAYASGGATNVTNILINQAAGTRTNVGITIANNNLMGVASPAGSTGVTVSPGSGAFLNVAVGPNMMFSLGTGVLVSSGVTNYCYIAGGNYATTATSGGTSVCH